MNPLRVDRFYIALRAGIKASFAALKRECAGERLYGYALVVGDRMHSVGAAAHTEEGLDRVAERYVGLGYRVARGDVRPHLRALLRWNCGDGWTHFAADPNPFATANALLAACGDPHTEFYAGGGAVLTEQLFLAALHKCHAAGVMGQDRSVTVTLHTGDDGRDVGRWVKRANPPEVFERWATDQKLAAKAAKAITPGTG
ncbi:MAG TPA: DUF4303 domain-containing protein [Urbifossiella sp.]|nr:DUF4303 domain-containing protein [Urbifossiella sp.]